MTIHETIERSRCAASLVIRLALWAGLAVFICWVWRTSSPVPLPDWSRLGITLIKDKVYRTDGSSPLTLDLYLPASRGETEPFRLRPVLIAIHGGSWYGGSKVNYRSDPRNTVIRLAHQGIVVVAIDYRLARAGAPTWPAVLDDVREAVRWVRRQAAVLHVDPATIVVMGQSAGAHLAALAAMTPDQPGPDGVSARIQGVVSFYGPTDLNELVNFRHLNRDPVRTFLGDSAPTFNRRASEASPLNHVSSDDPPMLLIHGTDDLWVPPEQSIRMAEASSALGAPSSHTGQRRRGTGSRPCSRNPRGATFCRKSLLSWNLCGMFRL